MTPSMQKVLATRRRLVRNRRIVAWCVSVAAVVYIGLGLIASHEQSGSDLAVVLIFMFAFMWVGRR